jgi:hypothetical protein
MSLPLVYGHYAKGGEEKLFNLGGGYADLSKKEPA